MLESRYEEYNVISKNLPCVFHSNIERTNLKYSKHTNWHENLEIELCTKGEGFILLDGERQEFQKGDIAVINSNVIHYTGTNTALNYDCLIIDTKFSELTGINPQNLCFKPLIKSDTIKDQFTEITKIYNNLSDICATAKLQTAVLKILIELREQYTVFENVQSGGSKYFEAVKETIRFIKENYSTKITLDTLSKNVYTDKYTLSKKFKEVTGSTIVQYINSYRCEKAIELIRDGNPINEAAVKCGFNNMSFFTRTFKSYTGKLPSKYAK